MENAVEPYKKGVAQEVEIFLRNFSKVPDDRLTWTPVPTSKSALRIAAHTALYLGRFASMIREQKLPMPENLEEWLAQRNAEEAAVESREEVQRIFQEGLEEVNAALDSLPPEAVDSVLDSGQGWTMSMRWLMKLPAWHTTLHLGQIDFLQTCWGDQEIYVG
jgi:hypothetical protein